MSGLNKRALYKMATKNSANSTPTFQNGNQGSGIIELNQEAVKITPLPTGAPFVPDGRIAGRLAPTANKHSDGVTVSHRARKQDVGQDRRRAEVLQKVGCNSLGHLTNAYLEQKVMTENEMHSLQQRFYGLHSV